MVDNKIHDSILLKNANSRLVETPFESTATTTREVLLNSAPSVVEKKEVVGSPVESSISSEISR